MLIQKFLLVISLILEVNLIALHILRVFMLRTDRCFHVLSYIFTVTVFVTVTFSVAT